MKEKKNTQKMIKLYYDTKSLLAGISLLSKSDIDFNTMIYDKIYLHIYPLVDINQIDNNKIKNYMLNEILNLVEDNIINNPTNYMWQLSLTRNSMNLRTDKYNSFGWNIIKDEKGEDMYRIYLTLYGHKTNKEYLTKYIMSQKKWKILETRGLHERP